MLTLTQVLHRKRARAAANARGRGPAGARGYRWWVSCSVSLAIALGALPVSRTWAEPQPPLRVGLLDIRIIFERYQKIASLDQALQKEIARYQEQIDARRTALDSLERTARAPEWRRNVERPSAQALADARQALRETRQEAIEELRLLEKDATADVVAEIRRAAEREAQARGLDIVMDETDASILFARSDGELVVDVTEAVLARMNAR